MHMGRDRKLASEQSWSGVTIGGAGFGSEVGVATTALGVLLVCVAEGMPGASTLAGLEAALRGRSMATGRGGVLLSMMVSMGSLLATSGAGGVVARMISSAG